MFLQMGKQTMGTPCHNWLVNSATKMYRLQTPSTPLVRPIHYDAMDMDNYAMGTNAIIAVISYTVSLDGIVVEQTAQCLPSY